MLVMRMNLLRLQLPDKMNNNLGTLHYESYDDDSGDSRMLSSSTGDSRTGTPISPTKRKFDDVEVANGQEYQNQQMAKMSCLLSSQLGNPADGDTRPEPWSHCHNPFEQVSTEHPFSGLHAGRLYSPFHFYAMEQPLALTKHSTDTARSSFLPSLSSTERQQNRPSVITCAPASNRTCSLSNCHMSPNGFSPDAYNIKSKTNDNGACDPVIEEHFRRSLGNIYREPEAGSNSVSITGSVDDHFAQALGDTWLQIKAKGSGSRSPESSS